MLKRWLSKSNRPSKKKNDTSLETNSINSSNTRRQSHHSRHDDHESHVSSHINNHSLESKSGSRDNISGNREKDDLKENVQKTFTPLRTIVSLETPCTNAEPVFEDTDSIDGISNTNNFSTMNDDVMSKPKNFHGIDRINNTSSVLANNHNKNVNSYHEASFSDKVNIDLDNDMAIDDYIIHQDNFHEEKMNSTSSSLESNDLDFTRLAIAKTKTSDILPFGDGSNKVFGYENFGYTCYCNSVLQCLYNIPEFRLNVLEYPHVQGLRVRKNEMVGRSPRVFNESLFAHNTSHVGPVNPDNDNENDNDNSNDKKDNNVEVKSPSTTKKLFPGFLKHSSKNFDTESTRSQSPIIPRSLRESSQDINDSLKKTESTNKNSYSNNNNNNNSGNKTSPLSNDTSTLVNDLDFKVNTSLDFNKVNSTTEHKEHHRPKTVIVGRTLPTEKTKNLNSSSLTHDEYVTSNDNNNKSNNKSNNNIDNDNSNDNYNSVDGNKDNNLNNHEKNTSSANNEGKNIASQSKDNMVNNQQTNEQRKKSALINGPIINIDYSLNHNEKSNLYNAVKDIFECINENDSLTGVVSPIKFINVLKKENVLFNTMMHQDAHEFLNFLLNDLSEYADKKSSKFINNMSDKIAESGPNFIKKIFEGTQTSRIKCLTCDSVTSRNEPFLDFPIEVQDNQETDIQELLQKFHQRELLCGSNKFYCNVCSGLQEAERIVGMKKLPKLLALHLKRFKYSERENANIKLFNSIKYPLILNVTSTFDESIQKKYELTGIVMHMGAGPQHGHYVSVCKTEQFGWLLYDDETVDTIEEATVLKFFGDQHSLTTAYVLFYKEIEDIAINEIDENIQKKEIQKNIEELLKYDSAWRAKISKEKAPDDEDDAVDETIDTTINDSMVSEDKTFSSSSKPSRRRSRLFSFMKN